MTTEYLLNREVEHVLAALTPSNALVCQVILHTGLRVGDALELKTKDLAPRMWVQEHKTGKRRLVGLPAPLLEALREQAGRVWVFESRCDPAKHRTRQAVWKDVKRAADAFRLRQNAGTHSFRKVYAVDLMKKYGDIERVKRNLKHDRNTTTMIYAMADQMLQQKKLSKAAHLGRRSVLFRP